MDNPIQQNPDGTFGPMTQAQYDELLATQTQLLKQTHGQLKEIGQRIGLFQQLEGEISSTLQELGQLVKLPGPITGGDLKSLAKNVSTLCVTIGDYLGRCISDLETLEQNTDQHRKQTEAGLEVIRTKCIVKGSILTPNIIKPS